MNPYELTHKSKQAHAECRLRPAWINLNQLRQPIKSNEWISLNNRFCPRAFPIAIQIDLDQPKGRHLLGTRNPPSAYNKALSGSSNWVVHRWVLWSLIRRLWNIQRKYNVRHCSRWSRIMIAIRRPFYSRDCQLTGSLEPFIATTWFIIKFIIK